jgi:hypothetical protein
MIDWKAISEIPGLAAVETMWGNVNIRGALCGDLRSARGPAITTAKNPMPSIVISGMAFLKLLERYARATSIRRSAPETSSE